MTLKHCLNYSNLTLFIVHSTLDINFGFYFTPVELFNKAV